MIRKLRIKIVLVIVLVAAVMLGVIFGMSYTMTRQDLRAQSISMMQAIAANPFEPLPPGQSRQVRLPYFVLRTDAFGNLVAIGSTDYDLTDRSFLRAVAAAASASEADIGEIPAYHLRFCRVDGSVIFADISSEQQTLQGLVRSSLLIGGGISVFAPTDPYLAFLYNLSGFGVGICILLIAEFVAHFAVYGIIELCRRHKKKPPEGGKPDEEEAVQHV